jgi:hypothetical protein
MNYYYGQPMSGHPNPNQPYTAQSPYPPYQTQPQQPLAHAPADGQSYFGYANPSVLPRLYSAYDG